VCILNASQHNIRHRISSLHRQDGTTLLVGCHLCTQIIPHFFKGHLGIVFFPLASVSLSELAGDLPPPECGPVGLRSGGREGTGGGVRVWAFDAKYWRFARTLATEDGTAPLPAGAFPLTSGAPGRSVVPPPRKNLMSSPGSRATPICRPHARHSLRGSLNYAHTTLEVPGCSKKCPAHLPVTFVFYFIRARCLAALASVFFKLCFPSCCTSI